MKNILTLLIIAILAISCNQEAENKSTKEVNNLGVSITTENIIKASELIAKMGESDSLACKVEGKIDEVCQKSAVGVF